nr:ATP-binding cassette domain-containing protein [Actinokineospora enzanensis]
MLRLAGIGKRYDGDHWVLRDVDLTLTPGTVTAIVGGNGSGKSTLLRIIAGVSRPSTGTVTGRPPVVGYVPERFPPGERMSALAYLTHLGRVRGLRGPAAHDRACELLDRLALVGGVHSSLRTLSKGNSQKVALAQALLVPPRLLVLDEPWSGLDTDTHGVLAAIIAETAADGGTVLFTDHRESVTRAHATHRHRITAGHVQALDDGPDHLVEVVLSTGTHDPGWDALTGVVSSTHHDGRVHLRVERAHSDGLLTVALRHGWSVERLTQEAAR